MAANLAALMPAPTKAASISCRLPSGERTRVRLSCLRISLVDHNDAVVVITFSYGRWCSAQRLLSVPTDAPRTFAGKRPVRTVTDKVLRVGVTGQRLTPSVVAQTGSR